MRRIYLLVVLLTFCSLVVFIIIGPKLYRYYQRYQYTHDYQHVSLPPQQHTPDNLYKTHIVGGFSIDTQQRASKASSDGIQVVFRYGQPPSESDQLGTHLQNLHMKVMDGYISSYLTYYECHRTMTVISRPAGQEAFCQTDEDPSMNSEEALLNTIAHHLQHVQHNPLIIGYWVLDDWVTWDAGSARELLIKIHQLIQRYTPDRPAICGFGASLGPEHTSTWHDALAANFSPKSCDMLGLYIYASSPPDTYDWSMSDLLPAMFASLQRRGWDMHKEPFIGIGQGFGGPLSTGELVNPDAQDMLAQSTSFCEHGATGIAFYAWDSDNFTPATQTPMTSGDIEAGIRNSIETCTTYWKSHS